MISWYQSGRIRPKPGARAHNTCLSASKRYLQRLYDTIISRGDVHIEQLDLDDRSNVRGSIKGRIRFYDDSLLQFNEAVFLRGKQIIKRHYTYHYQNLADELIFRYDNVPHHAHIPTYPHHKHVGTTIESAQPPDLSDVLHEIEQIIYD